MQKILLRAWLIIFFVLSAGLIACKSQSNVSDELQSYDSINLEFSLSYPSQWKIFETSESILISTDVSNFIAPPDTSSLQDNDFFISISVLENEEFVRFLETIPNKSTKNLNGSIELNSLDNFQDYSEEKPELRAMYQNLFLVQSTEYTKYLAWRDTLLIGENLASDKGEYTFYIVKHLQQAIVVVMTIQFKFVNEDIPFKEFFAIADSIKLDYNE